MSMSFSDHIFVHVVGFWVYDLCRVLFAGFTSFTYHCTRDVVTPTPSMLVHAVARPFLLPTSHVTHLYIHNASFESPVLWFPLHRI